LTGIRKRQLVKGKDREGGGKTSSKEGKPQDGFQERNTYEEKKKGKENKKYDSGKKEGARPTRGEKKIPMSQIKKNGGDDAPKNGTPKLIKGERISQSVGQGAGEKKSDSQYRERNCKPMGKKERGLHKKICEK